jgi:hypothetical protein
MSTLPLYKQWVEVYLKLEAEELPDEEFLKNLLNEYPGLVDHEGEAASVKTLSWKDCLLVIPWLCHDHPKSEEISEMCYTLINGNPYDPDTEPEDYSTTEELLDSSREFFLNILQAE